MEEVTEKGEEEQPRGGEKEKWVGGGDGEGQHGEAGKEGGGHRTLFLPQVIERSKGVGGKFLGHEAGSVEAGQGLVATGFAVEEGLVFSSADGDRGFHDESVVGVRGFFHLLSHAVDAVEGRLGDLPRGFPLGEERAGVDDVAAGEEDVDGFDRGATEEEDVFARVGFDGEVVSGHGGSPQGRK